MNECLNCGRETENAKFCSNRCSAIYNNKLFPKRKKTQKLCLLCGKNITYKKGTYPRYCNNKHQMDHKYRLYIERWLSGNEMGGNSDRGYVSNHIRRYLLEMNHNKCEICGWCEINKYSGTIPLEIDHIDGDSSNNNLINLRLLCPNCHSLTANYGILNKGRGRPFYRNRYRDLSHTPIA